LFSIKLSPGSALDHGLPDLTLLGQRLATRRQRLSKGLTDHVPGKPPGATPAACRSFANCQRSIALVSVHRASCPCGHAAPAGPCAMAWQAARPSARDRCRKVRASTPQAHRTHQDHSDPKLPSLPFCLPPRCLTRLPDGAQERDSGRRRVADPLCGTSFPAPGRPSGDPCGLPCRCGYQNRGFSLLGAAP